MAYRFHTLKSGYLGYDKPNTNQEKLMPGNVDEREELLTNKQKLDRLEREWQDFSGLVPTQVTAEIGRLKALVAGKNELDDEDDSGMLLPPGVE